MLMIPAREALFLLKSSNRRQQIARKFAQNCQILQAKFRCFGERENVQSIRSGVNSLTLLRPSRLAA